MKEEKRKKAIRIAPEDTVVVAVEEGAPGDLLDYGTGTVLLKEAIPFGHKAAIALMEPGEKVMKYGYPIGQATKSIHPGEWVHSHNLKTGLAKVDAYEPPKDYLRWPEEESKETFQGFLREDGSVGIRNEIWIIPLVGCVNGLARELMEEANARWGEEMAIAFPHNMGCSQLGGDLRFTQETLAGLAKHPNAAGVLLVGLGCENNTWESFQEVLGPVSSQRVKFLLAQGEEDEREKGRELLEELRTYGKKFQRTACPVSKLTIGFKCGGSDGFSGLTANPLCGRVCDKMVKAGGSGILTEVPEMFGAERILMERSTSPEVWKDLVGLIQDFKQYFIRYHQEVYENPSPGNRAGGITTLEEKSLGCIQKGGRSPIAGILHTGEPRRGHGLFLLSGPGNDGVSCTNLAAAGAQMILFTTGRGNPLGGPVPTVKIASNTPLMQKKPHWVDYNGGNLLEGVTEEEQTKDFWQLLLTVAEGKKTRNEENHYRDISIFRDGVIL